MTITSITPTPLRQGVVEGDIAATANPMMAYIG
jgi:hypothetical protein